MIKKKEIFEKKEITIEQVMAAVSLSKAPSTMGFVEVGEVIYVKRAGAVKTLPIQYILNRLRAEHPDTKFVFGDEPKVPSSPTDQ